MEEIRCPMCGKPNPEDIEICQHCEARLKPLMVSSDADFPQDSDDTDSGLPDWLRVEPPDETPPEVDANLDDKSSADDWLIRLREESDSAPIDITAPGEHSPSGEPEDEDWLKRVRALRDAEAETKSPAENDSSSIFDSQLPSWMSSETDEPAPQEGAPPEEDPSSIFDGALPSWMSDQVEEPPAEEQVSEPGSSIPDWLSDSQDLAEQIDEPVEAKDAELPEWISSPEEVDSALPDRELEGEKPDWLAKLDESSEDEVISEPLPEEALPDWITASEENGAVEHAEASPDEETVGEELPDWLTTLSESESDFPPASEPMESGLTDWIKDSASKPEAASPSESLPAPSVPESTQDPDSELPIWIQETAEDEGIQQTEESVGEVIPDWLLSTDETGTDALPKDELIDDGIPDWMSGEEDEIEPPASTIPAEPDPEAPDWLSGLEKDGLGWPAPGEGESPSEDLETDWLDKIEDDEIPDIGEFEPTGEDLFEIEELTELLSEVDADGQLSEFTGGEADGLAPAELPGWLEAMRPVESSQGGEGILDQGSIEQSGPLAGLSGVLMAEPEIARLRKAPKLTSMLHVTDAQNNHVKVFKELLETEGQAPATPKPVVVTSQGILRWLSAFFLILVIGLVVIGETQFVPELPLASVPAEVINTSELVNALEPQDPVLISFDFEPGTSGEMDAAAAAVVDHLMIRGAYLTLVSTSPTGPALAEHFITFVQKEHQYTSGSQYANLGFIPGGASGLLGFVQMPQRITPLTFDGMAAWKTRPLQGVFSLADFNMVIVITDNPDTARSWIEQVEPRLQGTPLIAVVSAQAEPILRPYVGGEDAQVRGMVGGVIGGAAYEQVTGKPNLARTYWDALNYGLMTAIAAILIGGAANIFKIVFKRSKPGRPDGINE